LVFLKAKKPDIFIKIQENLEVLGWYDGFDIPNDLNFTEKRLRIKDRYLDETMPFLNQRSANEGFLFLLFYFTLTTSPYTPRFFAIDNIDNGMNPKMCMELMRILTRLAKKYGKQVIFTTHNPAILDGLNLGDDEQRLLVVSRNKIGHTKIRRIEQDGIPESAEPRRLSELFLDGMLGGLPKNF
jgi:predicted ATPase